MGKQLKKVQGNMRYVKNQVRLFLKHVYGVEYAVEVYGNKVIEKQGYYSKLEFKGGRPVAIDLSYNLLLKAGKEDILKAGLREAVKVALWYKRVSYMEDSKEYITELIKYKLPVYGNERQTGKDLHTYGCSKCKKVYVIRENKLTGKSDITVGSYKTACCAEPFEYMDKKHFSGEMLYKIKRNQSKKGKG